MEELADFGTLVLVVAAGFLVALFGRKLSERFPIPAPAIFLVAAAIAPALISNIRTVERIGVVALIVILFDGGMHVGWRRFRLAWAPIASLGIVGTLATGSLMALAAHYLLGFE